MPPALDEYLQTRVMTATPVQLHLMVVDGAIRNAADAERSLTKRRFDDAHGSIGRANAFVGELIAGLDPSRLPGVVENLKSLFLFIHHNLVEADRQRDPRRAADALSILRMHRETWVALGEKLAREAPTEAPRPEGGFSWST